MKKIYYDSLIFSIYRNIGMVKISKIERGQRYTNYTYSFRWWHPCILLLGVYSFVYEIIKHSYEVICSIIEEITYQEYHHQEPNKRNQHD